MVFSCPRWSYVYPKPMAANKKSTLKAKYIDIRTKLNLVMDNLNEYFMKTDYHDYSWPYDMNEIEEAPSFLFPDDDFEFTGRSETEFFIGNLIFHGEDIDGNSFIDNYLKEHSVPKEDLPYYEALKNSRATILAVKEIKKSSNQIIMRDLLTDTLVTIIDTNLVKMDPHVLLDRVLGVTITSFDGINCLNTPTDLGMMNMRLHLFVVAHRNHRFSDGMLLFSCFYNRVADMALRQAE